MDAPEKDVKLEPGGVHPRDQHHHGEDELEDLLPADAAELRGEEEGVEVAAVEDAEPHVEEEEAKVAVVAVADAVADKHAVVLSLEDADVANVAVPGARRCHRLAGSAKVPLGVLNTSKKIKQVRHPTTALTKY